MTENFIPGDVNINDLVSNHENFYNFVYTSLDDAVLETGKRFSDTNLETHVIEYLRNDIPVPLRTGSKAVLFRQLCTPNNELIFFLKKIKENNLEPVFFEYYNDKFTALNPIKYSLGKINFQAEMDNKDIHNLDSRIIIDFEKSEGKKIKEINTIWDQSLISFHHELLEEICPNNNKFLYDASDWFNREGKYAREYYEKYVALFIRNSILCENFILEGDELNFIKKIFLPAFIHAWRLFGKKPLIVSLLPLNSQNESFWTNYPTQILDCINHKKMI